MQALPVIHRISPQLPLGAEIVWRYPGDKARAPASVELEPLGVGPNVAGVRRHEKRYVTNQSYPTLVGIFFQLFSLAEQEELGKPALVDLRNQVMACASQRRRLSPDQFLRPIQEIGVSVVRLQGAEQRVIVQPM